MTEQMPDHSVTAYRHVWLFAPVFLVLVFPVRLAHAQYWAGLPGVIASSLLFVLPMMYVLPRARRVWNRHRGLLLVLQAVLTTLPAPALGGDWMMGTSGLLGGLVLLTVRSPGSWILLLGLIVAEVGRVGWITADRTVQDSLALTTSSVVVLINTALAMYGLVRLADMISTLQATAGELTVQAVRAQQLRSARALRLAIGNRLSRVIRHADSALKAHPAAPGAARRQIREAALVAREAAAEIRGVIGRGMLDDDLRSTATPDLVAAQPARLALFGVLCGFLVQLLSNIFGRTATSSVETTMSVMLVLIVLGLQVRHSLGSSTGSRPAHWPVTLAVQALVAAGAIAVTGDLSVLGLTGFAVGSGLLLLPPTAGWTVFATAPIVVGAVTALHSPFGYLDSIYSGAATAATALIIFGLSRLADIARRVDRARRTLAATAVTAEQVRIERDAHDLLGLCLSAIALKCDLVVRLIERDDVKARAELALLQELARQGQQEMRSIAHDTRTHLALDAEIATASSVLHAAGVRMRVPASPQDLPEEVESALATVLREATTNVVRHSHATQCVVEFFKSEQAIRMRITNDGLPREPVQVPGSGLDNLQARAHQLGGVLHVDSDAPWFTLTVEFPVRQRSRPATRVGPAHRQRPAAGH